jgi:NADH-quinone oxidoreductase subunit L
MFIVAIIGAATALFAATIGLAQHDLKGLSVFDHLAAQLHVHSVWRRRIYRSDFRVMTHAFFKAQLFLVSGSVIPAYITNRTCAAWATCASIPIVWLTMCCGWLAICGVPTAGFSKDEILWKV